MPKNGNKVEKLCAADQLTQIFIPKVPVNADGFGTGLPSYVCEVTACPI